MKITRVESFRVELPLPQPICVAGHVVRLRDYHLVRIDTDDGITGWGYSLARGGDVAGVVDRNLAPLLLEEDPRFNEKLWEKLYRATAFIGRMGLVVRALSMVDLAIWDIKAKKAGLPLYLLLGGNSSSVPVAAVGGYYVEGVTVEDLHDEVKRLSDKGYWGVKIAAGSAPREDEDRLESARRALGDTGRLMVDINWAWRDVKAAIRTARRWAQFDLTWIEEPFPPENLNARRRFCRTVETPLALGDEQCGLWNFRQWIESGAVDILRPDATVVGGVTEFVKIAALAAAWDLPLAPHYYPDVHVHLAAAFPHTLCVEDFSETAGLDSFHLLRQRPLEFENGLLKVPDEPGLGFEVNLENLERYGVRP